MFILAFITQEAWSLKKGRSGFHEGFYTWLKEQIAEHDLPGLAAKVFGELETAGIAPGVALTESLKELHPGDPKVAVYPYAGMQHQEIELDG